MSVSEGNNPGTATGGGLGGPGRGGNTGGNRGGNNGGNGNRGGGTANANNNPGTRGSTGPTAAQAAAAANRGDRGGGNDNDRSIGDIAHDGVKAVGGFVAGLAAGIVGGVADMASAAINSGARATGYDDNLGFDALQAIDDKLAEWGIIESGAVVGGEAAMRNVRAASTIGLSTTAIAQHPKEVAAYFAQNPDQAVQFTSQYRSAMQQLTDPSYRDTVQATLPGSSDTYDRNSGGDGVMARRDLGVSLVPVPDSDRWLPENWGGLGDFLTGAVNTTVGALNVRNQIRGLLGKDDKNNTTKQGDEDADSRWSKFLEKLGARAANAVPDEFKQGAFKQIERDYVERVRGGLSQYGGVGLAAAVGIAGLLVVLIRR